jgi:hypothetical protein
MRSQSTVEREKKRGEDHRIPFFLVGTRTRSYKLQTIYNNDNNNNKDKYCSFKAATIQNKKGNKISMRYPHRCITGRLCALLLAMFLVALQAAAAAATSDALPLKEELLVKGLEEIEPAFAEFQGDMYAGTLPMDNHYGVEERTGELMFWLFAAEEPAAKKTLTIWVSHVLYCLAMTVTALTRIE